MQCDEYANFYDIYIYIFIRSRLYIYMCWACAGVCVRRAILHCMALNGGAFIALGKDMGLNSFTPRVCRSPSRVPCFRGMAHESHPN